MRFDRAFFGFSFGRVLAGLLVFCTMGAGGVSADPLPVKGPSGIPVDGFLFSPGVQGLFLYDDNIFRDSGHPVSDLISELRPHLSVDSQWDRHALSAFVDAALGSYLGGNRDDYTNFLSGARGRYDLTSQTSFSGEISRGRQQAWLGAADDQNRARGGYNFTTFKQLTFAHVLNDFTFRLSGLERETNLAQVNLRDYQARRSQGGLARVDFEYLPESHLFVCAAYDDSGYRIREGARRDSVGTDFRAGLEYDGGGLYAWSLFGGQIRRLYEDQTPDFRDPYIGGSFRWDPFRLTRVSFSFDRVFLEGSDSDFAGALQTTRQLEVVHQATPLFDLTVRAGWDDTDYIGTAGVPDYSSRLYSAGIQGEYKVSEEVGLRLGYDHRRRASDRLEDGYQNNQILFSLVYKR